MKVVCFDCNEECGGGSEVENKLRKSLSHALAPNCSVTTSVMATVLLPSGRASANTKIIDQPTMHPHLHTKDNRG